MSSGSFVKGSRGCQASQGPMHICEDCVKLQTPASQTARAPPNLVAIAAFIAPVDLPPRATSLMVKLDDQPTNRAGMSGLAECSHVLHESTVAILRGNDPETPKCFWTDDSTFVVYLTT